MALLGSLLSTCSNFSIFSMGYNLRVSSFISGTKTERMGGFLDMSKTSLLAWVFVAACHHNL